MSSTQSHQEDLLNNLNNQQLTHSINLQLIKY